MSGTVERYGKGWRYRTQVGIDPATGKRRWASKGGFATQKAARTALHTVLSDADDGLVVQRSRLTVADYLDDWFDRAQVDLKPTTVAGYRRAITKLEEQLGQVRLQDLTTLAVERAYHSLTVMMGRGLRAPD